MLSFISTQLSNLYTAVSHHHTQCHIILHSVTSLYIHSATSSHTYMVSHHHTQCHLIIHLLVLSYSVTSTRLRRRAVFLFFLFWSQAPTDAQIKSGLNILMRALNCLMRAIKRLMFLGRWARTGTNCRQLTNCQNILMATG